LVFGKSQYVPDTSEGKRLLAHELTHTIQQGEADPAVSEIGQPGNNRAQEASPAARKIISATAGTLCVLGNGGGVIRRQGADAAHVGLQSALAFNAQQSLDRRSITICQALVAAPSTGIWDETTIQRIMVWQRSHGIGVDGKVGPQTLQTLVEELKASRLFDDAIHIIVDFHRFPTTNLASIAFDATVTGADALTTGTIAAGQPQTVRVGPSTFSADYAHMIRIIGHEFQHVQQRSGATPIVNQHVREFLAFAWEALSTTSPALAAGDRVGHANIAISHWNAAPPADRAPHQTVRDRLDRLIAAHGIGNF
jgi:peptidoglycan hydrolase-like protein with peptidoglycan-binding domain